VGNKIKRDKTGKKLTEQNYIHEEVTDRLNWGYNLGGLLFRPGATSFFSDPLLENTFFSPLHVSA
jgi:hypothetical protein